MGDAPAAERGKVLDRQLRAALIVRQQAKRVRVLDLREHIDDGQAARGRSIGARRSARRAVTTRPSTRLRSNWSMCRRSRKGSSVALHMKTAMP